MKQKSTFLFLLFASFAFLLLVGTSCNTEEESEESSDSEETTEADNDINLDEFCEDTGSSTTTPHDSIICDGRDSALIGNWQLESQTVAGSSLRLAGTPPSVEGRMLTFYDDSKSYTEDYSAEKFEKMSVTTPDGDASEQCHSTGTNSGAYNVTFEIVGEDEDEDVPENDEEQVRLFLEVNRDANLDPEGIKSICDEGPGGQTVESSASVPLGTGASSTTCDGDNFLGGPCVRYSYSISEDGSLLTISTTTGPAATYTFRKR